MAYKIELCRPRNRWSQAIQVTADNIDEVAAAVHAAPGTTAQGRRGVDLSCEIPTLALPGNWIIETADGRLLVIDDIDYQSAFDRAKH